MTDFTLTYLRPKKAEVYRRLSGDYVDRTGDLRIDEHEDVVLTPLGQLAGASTDNCFVNPLKITKFTIKNPEDE